MSKELLFNDNARVKIKKGIDTLADAVKVTLGPKGRNVVIERNYGAPHITKDGVTVAKEIELEDKFENIGAQLVKQVAAKTGDDAGDGTTTATVLAQAIVNEGMKYLAAGISPIEMKKGIDKAVAKVIEFIKEKAVPVDNKIEQIATISANNDPEIGKLIADAMEQVGRDGVITLEESKTAETTIKVVEGMQFDRGYLSPYFVTDPDMQQCVMENPLILIADQKLSNLKDFLGILESAVQTGRPLLIIAEDVDQEALTTLVVNRMRAQLKICAVKAPYFGEKRKESLNDIAILTGGTVMNSVFPIDKATIDQLGSAEKVIITKDNTLIINGNGSKELIQAQCDVIKALIEANPDPYLKERLAKLSGGIAVMYVGAPSEVEMREKKDRVDDALRATRAAIEEGIVAGGGSILAKAAHIIDNYEYDPGIKAGKDIIINALTAPIKQICSNAGVSGEVVLNQIQWSQDNYGYDAKNDKYYDLVENGIIDPAKVTRVSLENAASIASMFLTTECVIVNKKENNTVQY